MHVSSSVWFVIDPWSKHVLSHTHACICTPVLVDMHTDTCVSASLFLFLDFTRSKQQASVYTHTPSCTPLLLCRQVCNRCMSTCPYTQPPPHPATPYICTMPAALWLWFHLFNCEQLSPLARLHGYTVALPTVPSPGLFSAVPFCHLPPHLSPNLAFQGGGFSVSTLLSSFVLGPPCAFQDV